MTALHVLRKPPPAGVGKLRSKHARRAHLAGRIVWWLAVHGWALRLVVGPALTIMAVWHWAGWWALPVALALVAWLAVSGQTDGTYELLARRQQHRWRAARLRVRWAQTMAGAGLVRAGATPTLLRIRVTPIGLRLTVRPVDGQAAAGYHVNQDGLRRTWQATRLEISEPRAGRVRIDVVYADPLARPIGWTPPGQLERGLVPVGVSTDGELVSLPMLRAHVLVGGLSGSGKSSFLDEVLASVAPRPDVALILIDPKRVELARWAPRACTPVGVGAMSIREALALAVKTVDDRYAQVERSGGRAHTPTPDAPTVLVVIDELASLTMSPDRKDRDRNIEQLTHLTRLGRAAQVFVLAATQRPAADTVPAMVRDLFQLRVGFATSTGEMTDIVLGDGAQRLAPAHTIPHDQPGRCYVVTETSRQAVLMRAFHVSDAQVLEVVAATAALARPLGVGPVPLVDLSKPSARAAV